MEDIVISGNSWYATFGDGSGDGDEAGDAVNMGVAAAMLLESPIVKEFFRNMERSLFNKFTSLDTKANIDECRDVIHKQNILSELLQYMRYLEQRREMILNKMSSRIGGQYGKKEDGREESESGAGTRAGNGSDSTGSSGSRPHPRRGGWGNDGTPEGRFVSSFDRDADLE